MKLKFLIVGLGSMGKRRIRNLFFNGEKEITGFDIKKSRRQEVKEKYGVKVAADFKKVKAEDYDVLFICTPPDQHGDYIRLAIKNKKHFFVEHPTDPDGYKEILKSAKAGLAMAPSCTFYFYRPILMIKKILDQGKIGKILAFQYHMAHYLPEWHPYENYRDVYFSKKQTGACREMLPFELIWLNWIFKSQVKEISGRVGKISNLKMSADDIILANIKYKNGILGNIIIDVVSRKPFRSLRVMGSDGVLEWEKFDSVIKIYGAKTKKTEIIRVPKGHPATGYVNEEEMYNKEIKTFLESVKNGKKFPHTFKDSLQLLNTLYTLEQNKRAAAVK